MDLQYRQRTGLRHGRHLRRGWRRGHRGRLGHRHQDRRGRPRPRRRQRRNTPGRLQLRRRHTHHRQRQRHRRRNTHRRRRRQPQHQGRLQLHRPGRRRHRLHPRPGHRHRQPLRTAIRRHTRLRGYAGDLGLGGGGNDIDLQNATDREIEVAAGLNLYITGDLVNGNGLRKTGTGSLYIDGGATAFAGDFTISAGAINFGSGTLGATSGLVTVADGAAIGRGSADATVDKDWRFRGDVIVGGTPGVPATPNTLTIQETGSADSAIDLTQYRDDPGTPAINVLDAGLVLSLASNVVSDAGLNLTGPGVVEFTVDNPNLDGDVAIQNGTLLINIPGTNPAVGGIDNTALVTVSAGATLELQTDETIAGVAGVGDVFLNGGDLTLTFDNTQTLTGNITGTGNLVLDLNVAGTLGTIELAGTNNFSGNTTLQDGVFIVGADNAFGTGTLTIEDTGDPATKITFLSTANPGNSYTLDQPITVNGDFALLADAILGHDGDLVLGSTANNNDVDFANATRGIEVDQALTLDIDGDLLNATGLTKTGLGTVALSGGASNFTGTFDVQEGILAFGNSTFGNDTVGITLADDAAIAKADAPTLILDKVFTFQGDLTAFGTGSLILRQTQGAGTLDLSTNRDGGLATPTPSITAGLGLTLTLDDPVVSTDGLILDGPGIVVLEQDNPNLDGDIDVQAGTLRVNQADTLADDALVTLATGTTFDVLSSETVGQVTGDGGISLTGDLTTQGTQDGTLNGVITGTTGDLILNNSGVTTFNATGTMLGDTRIRQGTIVLGADSPFGTTGTLEIGNAGDPDTDVVFASTSTAGTFYRLAQNVDLYSDVTITSVNGSEGSVLFGPVNNPITDLNPTQDAPAARVFTFTIDENLELFAGDIVDGAGIIKEGLGILNLDIGATDFTGDFTINEGTILFGEGDLGDDTGGVIVAPGAIIGPTADFNPVVDKVWDFQGDLIATGEGNPITPSESLTLQQSEDDAEITLPTGVVNASGLTLILDAAIAGNAGLTFTGTDTVQLLQDNPNLTGDVDVQGGALIVNATANALPDDALLTIGGGTAVGLLSDETIGQVTGDGDLALAANLTTAGNTDGILNGTVSGTGGLILGNTASLTLAGANTYAGGTVLNAGTLVLGSDTALGTADLTVNGGALASDDDDRTLANSLIFNDDLFLADGFDLTLTGDITVNLGVDGIFNIDVDAGQTLTLGGVFNFIGNPLVGINKTGDGQLVLTADNSLSITELITVAAGDFSLLGQIGDSIDHNGGPTTDLNTDPGSDVAGDIDSDSGTVTIAGNVQGDLDHDGATLDVSGTVGGNLTQTNGTAFTLSGDITGTAASDADAFLMTATASVGLGVTHTGTTAFTSAGDILAGGATTNAEDVLLTAGTITGDFTQTSGGGAGTTFDSTAAITGNLNTDALAFTLRDGATVGGDVDHTGTSSFIVSGIVTGAVDTDADVFSLTSTGSVGTGLTHTGTTAFTSAGDILAGGATTNAEDVLLTAGTITGDFTQTSGGGAGTTFDSTTAITGNLNTDARDLALNDGGTIGGDLTHTGTTTFTLQGDVTGNASSTAAQADIGQTASVGGDLTHTGTTIFTLQGDVTGNASTTAADAVLAATASVGMDFTQTSGGAAGTTFQSLADITGNLTTDARGFLLSNGGTVGGDVDHTGTANFILNGDITGDADTTASAVTIASTGSVGGDFTQNALDAQTFTAQGPITGNLTTNAATVNLTNQANIGGDVNHTGTSTFNIATDITGGVTTAARTFNLANGATIGGNVNQNNNDAAVFDAYGRIDGDVASAADTFTLRQGARIGGDLTYTCGGNLDLLARVAGDVISNAENLDVRSGIGGDLTHQAGTLTLNADIGGDFTSSALARLSGSPTVGGGVTLNDGSRLVLGDGTMLTLTVDNGNYLQRSGARVDFEIAKATNGTKTSDRIEVRNAGTATIAAGAQINIAINTAGDPGLIQSGDRWTLVSTENDNGVVSSLTPAGLVENALQVDFRLLNLGDQLVLEALVDSDVFTDVAVTGNEQAIAQAIGAGLLNNPSQELQELGAALQSLDQAGLRRAVNELVPRQSGAGLVNLTQTPILFSNTLSGHLTRMRHGVPLTIEQFRRRSELPGDGDPAGPQLASLAAQPELMQAVLTSQYGRNAYERLVEDQGDRNWAAFAQALAAYADTKDTDELAGSSTLTGGGIVGFSYGQEDMGFRVGSNLGVTFSDTDFDNNGGNADATSVRGGVFGSYTDEANWWVDAMASVGTHDISTTRNVNFPGFSASPEADYYAMDFNLLATVGYDIALPDSPNLTISPSGSVIYTHYSRDAYSEKNGGGANLVFDDHEDDFLDLAARVAFTYVSTNPQTRNSFVSELGVGWRGRVVGDTTDFDARFAGGGTTFTTTTETSLGHSGILDAALTWVYDDTRSISVRYAGQIGVEGMSHGFNLSWVYGF